MLQVITGGLLLSLVHAAIPNHWIPLAVTARSERWRRSESLAITAVAGFAHTLSTVLIGIVVGLVGYELAERFSSVVSVVAPTILILLGIFYIIFSPGHSHGGKIDADGKNPAGRKVSIILSLTLAMFFSPCLEIEAYYFTAGRLGWAGILTLSGIYLFVTVSGMVLLVYLGLRGIERLRSHFLEHNEKKITGLILVGLGILSHFVEY
jgi:nickel/cobalt exporter